jgi:hypothetical protein
MRRSRPASACRPRLVHFDQPRFLGRAVTRKVPHPNFVVSFHFLAVSRFCFSSGAENLQDSDESSL